MSRRVASCLGLAILAVLERGALAQAPAAALSEMVARIDDLHRRRDEPAAAAELKDRVKAALALAPGDYGVLWRAARQTFWLGDDATLEAGVRSRLGKLGWDLAERAIRANPNHVAGHFWAVANMGNYVVGLGTVRALTSGIDGTFKTRLTRAEALDPSYEAGAIPTAWGRYYAKLPWPKADPRRAEESFRRALRMNPNNLRARAFLAEFFYDKGRITESKAVLDEVRNARPGAYDAPEERRAKQRASWLLPKVLEKL